MKKPIIVIINGYPRSGKDTFCDIAVNEYECVNYSTVDTVKDIAKELGWDGTKTYENRNMLSELKDFTSRWFDMTYKEMIYMFNDSSLDNEDFIFLHIREPKDIHRIMDWCRANDRDAYSVFISRSAVKYNHDNHADNDVESMDYTCYISNNETISDFSVVVLDWLEHVYNGDIKKWVEWSTPT